MKQHIRCSSTLADLLYNFLLSSRCMLLCTLGWLEDMLLCHCSICLIGEMIAGKLLECSFRSGKVLIHGH